MAFVLNRQFDESTEQKMGAFVQTLSEKDRQRYAAMEAVKLGRGGIAYIADVLECSDRTIENGINELEMAYQTGRHATQEFPPEHEIRTGQSASAMELHGSGTVRLRQFICGKVSTRLKASFANELP